MFVFARRLTIVLIAATSMYLAGQGEWPVERQREPETPCDERVNCNRKDDVIEFDLIEKEKDEPASIEDPIVDDFPDMLSFNNCFSVFIAEYCLPDGSLVDLVPIDEITKVGLARAHRLKSERITSSIVPMKQREDLNEMWRSTLTEVFKYVDENSLKLETLTELATNEGSTVPSPSNILRALSIGPVFRVSFEETDGVNLRIEGPVLFHKQRMLALLSHISSAAPNWGAKVAVPLQASINLLPAQGDYVALNDFLQLSAMRPFVKLFERSATASEQNFLGVFGTEIVMMLAIAVDEAIRGQAMELSTGIKFYSDGSNAANEVDAPRVIWSGELLLSDEAITEFSEEEIRLLMIHEAMQLARPNPFTTFEISELIQRAKFPELNTRRAQNVWLNFLGGSNSGQSAECWLDTPLDDVLFVDYYVYYFYRNEPEKQRAYNNLIKRIHREFDVGENSQAAIRDEFGDAMLGRLVDLQRSFPNSETLDQQFWEGNASAFSKVFANYFAGKPMRADDFLKEVEHGSAFAKDVGHIRILLKYYQDGALSSVGFGSEGLSPLLTCNEFNSLLHGRQINP